MPRNSRELHFVFYTRPTGDADYTRNSEWNETYHLLGATKETKLEINKELKGGNRNHPFYVTVHGQEDGHVWCTD